MQKATNPRPLLLTGALAAVAAAVYLLNYRQPLIADNSRLRSSVTTLNEQISAKAAELRKLRAVAQLTKQDLEDKGMEESLLKTMPQPPMVYCPMGISDVLRKYQIQQTNPTLVMMIPFRDQRTLVRQNWQFSLPNNGVLPIGIAMAELENSFPLSQVHSFAITKNPLQPGVDAEMVLQFAVYR